MFCRKCYARLNAESPTTRCPRCDRPFDPTNPRSYLRRPFPSSARIVLYVIATTIVCIAAAFVVSFFQMVRMSGH
ncbi:MAG TPA: hypothetical protein VHY37_09620 [Tepidisphaeraceae bacterium]|nr:hypothetical protein [Tepidisphaeraceae bacterium]